MNHKLLDLYWTTALADALSIWRFQIKHKVWIVHILPAVVYLQEDFSFLNHAAL